MKLSGFIHFIHKVIHKTYVPVDKLRGAEGFIFHGECPTGENKKNI